MKKVAVFALSAALVASAACNALDKIISVDQSAPVATISMSAQASGGGYVTSPLALFYRTVGGAATIFTTAAVPHDTCNIRSGNNVGTLQSDTLPVAASPISAGSLVTMQLSGHTDTLLAPGPQSVGYRPATSFAFTPGDVATFNISGSSSGFPAASASVTTAEPFTMVPPRFAESGVDMPVTWTPATTPGSAMNFTMTYSEGPTTTQIYCQFIDDGHATVPAGFFVTYPNAVVNLPVPGPITAIRLRTSLVELPSGAVVNILSTFSYAFP